MTIHTCPECNLVHEAAVAAAESADVAIARINAEAQVRIAELQSRAEKHVADVTAEAEVDSARAEAHAVEAAMADHEADEHVVEAINAAAAGLDPEPEQPEPEPMEPVTIVQDNVDETAPPEHHEEHHEPAPKKSGLGLW